MNQQEKDFLKSLDSRKPKAAKDMTNQELKSARFLWKTAEQEDEVLAELRRRGLITYDRGKSQDKR